MNTRGEALLLTGVRGSGKSTVCGLIGDALEPRGLPYAAIDLDWLHWSNVAPEHELLVMNLRTIVANYRAVGVRYFVLAQSVANTQELADLKSAIGVPTRVARLTVPRDEILRRLRLDDRTQHDFDAALAQLDTPTDDGVADVDIPNVGPIDDTVRAVLDWMGWSTRSG